MNIVIVIEPECCICLDEIVSQSSTLSCCQTKIHEACMFQILMKKKDIMDSISEKCPMCRSLYYFTDVFTVQSMNEQHKKYNKDEKVFNFILNKYFKKKKTVTLFEMNEDNNSIEEKQNYKILVFSLILKIAVIIIIVCVVKMNKK